MNNATIGYDCATATVAQNGGMKRLSNNMQLYQEWLSTQHMAGAAQMDNAGPACKEGAGTQRVHTPYEDAHQTYSAPAAPNLPAFVAPAPSHFLPRSSDDPTPLEAQYGLVEWKGHAKKNSQQLGAPNDIPLQLTPPVQPQASSSTGVTGPRFSSALDAQMSHLNHTGWIPSSGIYGVPHTDEEQAPHVVRLFNAFIDTRAIYEDPDLVSNFQTGGLWTQDLSDIEAICWNLVQATAALHIVGTVGLQFRRMPHKRPHPNSLDSKLPFEQRIYLLELLVKHYKSFAHKMMLQKEVEEHLVYIGSLFRACNFRDTMATSMTEQQQQAVRDEWTSRRLPLHMQTMSSAHSGMTPNQSGSNIKRPLSASSEWAEQGPSKRSNVASLSESTDMIDRPSSIYTPTTYVHAPDTNQFSQAVPEHPSYQGWFAHENAAHSSTATQTPAFLSESAANLNGGVLDDGVGAGSPEAAAGTTEPFPTFEDFNWDEWVDFGDGEDVDLTEAVAYNA